MLFPTPEFAVFLSIVLVLARILAGRDGARKAMLAAASYVFYGWWSWSFAALLAASSAMTWGAGRLVAGAKTPGAKKTIAGVAVAIDLAVLGWFKYIDFALAQIDAGLSAIGWGPLIPLVGLAVPVGVSFFTFHAISYVVDLAVGRLKEPFPLLDVILYESFFPQLVAGPIVRASSFMPQLASPAGLRPVALARAGALIAGGLFKKVLVASALSSSIVDPTFRDPSLFSAPELIFAAIAYSVQILCDFSAYTDIAIGLAMLLGYEFPRNFERPYSALGFSDFWRRWHVSLSSWLRDYLYIPLGGSRGGFWRTTAALMGTMLIGGLWHGAAWTFVAWGALHGFALVFERGLRSLLPPGWSPPPALALLGRAGTFAFVTLAWIPFRSADFQSAWEYLSGFGRWEGGLVLPPAPSLALVVLVLALQAAPKDFVLRAVEGAISKRGPWFAGAAFGALCAAAMALGPEGVAPFIYFQF